MQSSHCVRYKTEGECIQDNKNGEENPKEVLETSESEDEIIIVEQPNKGQVKTQSVTGIRDEVQGLCAVAKVWVTDLSLFSNPFLNMIDVTILVQKAWMHAQDTQNVYGECTKDCRALVILFFYPSHVR